MSSEQNNSSILSMHDKLIQCKEELGISSLAVTEAWFVDMDAFSTDRESSLFDKALESVDEAIMRLESLLQQLLASSSSSGKEQIKAACSDLEKIRKLKRGVFQSQSKPLPWKRCFVVIVDLSLDAVRIDI